MIELYRRLITLMETDRLFAAFMLIGVLYLIGLGYLLLKCL